MTLPLKMIYDYEPDGSRRPVWLIADLDNINWDQDSLFLDVRSVFHWDIYDFTDDLIGCSVQLEDIVFSVSRKNQFGIRLKSIKHRTKHKGLDYKSILRFIIQVSDIKLVYELAEGVFDYNFLSSSNSLSN